MFKLLTIVLVTIAVYFCVGIQTSQVSFQQSRFAWSQYSCKRVHRVPETISAKIRMFVNQNDLTVCGDVFSSSSALVSAVQPFKKPNVLRYTKEILKSKKVMASILRGVPPLDDDKRTARLAANIICSNRKPLRVRQRFHDSHYTMLLTTIVVL